LIKPQRTQRFTDSKEKPRKYRKKFKVTINKMGRIRRMVNKKINHRETQRKKTQSFKIKRKERTDRRTVQKN